MAEIVLTNAYALINSVNLSDHVREIRIEYQAELQDITAMGDTTRNNLAGLLDFTITAEFNQDYASSNVDATLFPLIGAAGFAIAIKPVNTTISSTNPEYQATVVLESYSPAGGRVGDAHTTTAVFRPSGGAGITRDVTP